MSQVAFFSRLQNTDLHAVSAESVIKKELQLDYVVGLRRFSLWEMEADLGVAELRQNIAQICERSYFVINPNKEEMSWNVQDWLPTEDHVVSIQVRHRHTQQLDVICDKVNLFFNVDMKRVKRSTVWTLIFNCEVERRAWMQDIVLLGPSGTGFLAHPVTDTVTLLENGLND